MVKRDMFYFADIDEKFIDSTLSAMYWKKFKSYYSKKIWSNIKRT